MAPGLRFFVVLTAVCRACRGVTRTGRTTTLSTGSSPRSTPCSAGGRPGVRGRGQRPSAAGGRGEPGAGARRGPVADADRGAAGQRARACARRPACFAAGGGAAAGAPDRGPGPGAGGRGGAHAHGDVRGLVRPGVVVGPPHLAGRAMAPDPAGASRSRRVSRSRRGTGRRRSRRPPRSSPRGRRSGWRARCRTRRPTRS